MSDTELLNTQDTEFLDTQDTEFLGSEPMAFSVASTTLSTSWAEFSTMSFTAGTLGTLSTCIEEVQSKLNRGTLSATSRPSVDNVANWLSRAKQELAETRQYTWRHRYVTGTFTAGSYRYALPIDYKGGLVVRDMTNDFPIHVINQNTFNTNYPDPSELASGDVKVATVKNRELWVAPPPSAGITVELEYERSGDDIDPADFSWLPEIERFRCCDFAVSESFSSIHQWEESDRYHSKWNYDMQKAHRADGKKRWSEQGYRIRSIMGG